MPPDSRTSAASLSPHSPRKKSIGTSDTRLQRDAALPFGAHVAERAPAPLGLLGHRIEMRADRRNAVRVGGAQAEAHAREQVLVGPAQPVGLRRGQRIGERAGLTLGERTTVWPRSRWVCTSISIGQTCRPCRSTAAVAAAQRAASRSDARDRAALDQQIEQYRRRSVLGRKDRTMRAPRAKQAARARCGSNRTAASGQTMSAKCGGIGDMRSASAGLAARAAATGRKSRMSRSRAMNPSA